MKVAEGSESALKLHVSVYQTLFRISRGCSDNGQGCNRNLALAPTGLVQGPVLAVADLLLGGILETHCHLRLVLEG